jgi:hypothetical protein
VTFCWCPFIGYMAWSHDFNSFISFLIFNTNRFGCSIDLKATNESEQWKMGNSKCIVHSLFLWEISFACGTISLGTSARWSQLCCGFWWLLPYVLYVIELLNGHATSFLHIIYFRPSFKNQYSQELWHVFEKK